VFTYLITGSAGFIGSTLAHELIRSGSRVRGVDNFSTGKWENIADIATELDFREADLSDPKVAHAACEGVDVVFHEAANPSVPKSVQDPLDSNKTNLDATVNLLVAARDAKVKRVVYAASSSAYGDAPESPKEEGMIPDPVSPYAVAKLSGEHYMRSFYRCYRLETVCLRYFNVFGPRQDPSSPYSGVLAKFITEMIENRQPTIFGDGLQTRDFVYVDNVVQANLLASRAPSASAAGRVFNIAAGDGIALNHVFEIVKSMTNYGGTVRYAAERTGDIRHSVADVSLAARWLGYKPNITFEDGLRRTVDWYLAEARTRGGTERISTKEF
jgi:nucleoside-diphosphate-sugar epimerase